MGKYQLFSNYCVQCTKSIRLVHSFQLSFDIIDIHFLSIYTVMRAKIETNSISILKLFLLSERI